MVEAFKEGFEGNAGAGAAQKVNIDSSRDHARREER
jgi:hypothetical protein